jgi:hypothetical protein
MVPFWKTLCRFSRWYREGSLVLVCVVGPVAVVVQIRANSSEVVGRRRFRVAREVRVDGWHQRLRRSGLYLEGLGQGGLPWR